MKCEDHAKWHSAPLPYRSGTLGAKLQLPQATWRAAKCQLLHRRAIMSSVRMSASVRVMKEAIRDVQELIESEASRLRFVHTCRMAVSGRRGAGSEQVHVREARLVREHRGELIAARAERW